MTVQKAINIIRNKHSSLKDLIEARIVVQKAIENGFTLVRADDAFEDMNKARSPFECISILRESLEYK